MSCYVNTELVNKDELITRLYDIMDGFDKGGLNKLDICHGIQYAIDAVENMPMIVQKVNRSAHIIKAHENERKKCENCAYFVGVRTLMPSGHYSYPNACSNDYSKKLKKRVYPKRDCCSRFEWKEEHNEE